MLLTGTLGLLIFPSPLFVLSHPPPKFSDKALILQFSVNESPPRHPLWPSCQDKPYEVNKAIAIPFKIEHLIVSYSRDPGIRASKSGINIRDPISGPKCPDNIYGEKGPINIINNEPYIVYMLYYDQSLSILMDLEHFSSEFGRKFVRLCLFS